MKKMNSSKSVVFSWNFRTLARKRKYFLKNSDFYHIRNTKTFQVWTTTSSQKDQVLLLKRRNCKNNSMLHQKKFSANERRGCLEGWVIKLRKLEILRRLFSHWLVNKIREFPERLSKSDSTFHLKKSLNKWEKRVFGRLCDKVEETWDSQPSLL